MKTFATRVTLFMAVLGLAGCNSLSGDSIDTLRIALSGPHSDITPERINTVDAPVLVAKLGAAEAMMVSPRPLAELTEWHGVSEMLLTHGGRLVHTAGLPTDLIAPLVDDDPFLAGLGNLADGTEITRRVDYPARYLTGLRQHARYRIGPLETVSYQGRKHRLLRIDETIRMPELDFKATNHYWIEPETGRVRHSVQHIAPDLPPLHLTLVKTQGSQRP